MASSHSETHRSASRNAIAGIGIDLIEIDRFRQEDDLPEFLRQILTERELSEHAGILADPELCATLFAMKEAILKALGCGLEGGSGWREVEISSDFRATLSGGVRRRADQQSVRDVRIVPARAGSVAMALAIAES